jgi:cell division septal protein FtsQ
VPIVDLQTQLEGSFLYLIVLVAILFTCGWLTVILNISIPARLFFPYKLSFKGNVHFNDFEMLGKKKKKERKRRRFWIWFWE